MAGKGLNIALVDGAGQAAVVEKSGTKFAVRRPLVNAETPVPGAVVDGVYCANHFLDPGMQGMTPPVVPGGLNVADNSQKRLANIARFFEETPFPTVEDMVSLLKTSFEEGGLCQHTYPEMTTHYSYIVLPSKREMRVSQGIPCKDITFSTHRL